MQNFPLPAKLSPARSGLVAGFAVLMIAAVAWLAINSRPADAATADPVPEVTAQPAPIASPTPTPIDTRPPKPATRTSKAKRVPIYPDDRKHAGMKRVVYDKALMTVWLINKADEVVARYPVVGRWDRPKAGVYHVFSKSTKAFNPNSKVTFNHMVRFTYGPDTKSPIGLHAIPKYYDGTMMHSVKQLGLPIARGGCVRLSEQAAAAVYKFARVGTPVVVLPSP
ncbi:MAG: L,D-transpeptidase [Actinomycetota bacterium]|nr:L,D-transpeptidase [Actinomycetota bacterium]MDP2289145.1 L,D-transpeptidase [Actinomycetota bacterium]